MCVRHSYFHLFFVSARFLYVTEFQLSIYSLCQREGSFTNDSFINCFISFIKNIACGCFYCVFNFCKIFIMISFRLFIVKQHLMLLCIIDFMKQECVLCASPIVTSVVFLRFQFPMFLIGQTSPYPMDPLLTTITENPILSIIKKLSIILHLRRV